MSGPSDESEVRRRRPTGTWAGYLILALCLLFLIVWAAVDAYDRSWGRFAGITAVTVAFVLVPTGGVKWLRRSLRGRRRTVSR